MNQILATENEKNNYNKKSNNSSIVEKNYNPIIENDYSNSNYSDNYNSSNKDINDYSQNNSYYDTSENYSSNSYDSSRTNLTDLKKIIIIFSIIIITFGFAIGGVAVFKMLKNKTIKNSEPEVIMEQTEEGSQIKLSASYKKGVSKIIYYWDENDKQEINSNGEFVEKLVDIIRGDNTLTVILVDLDGNETKFTKKFSYYTDKEKPIIELSIVEEDAKLKIIATDETEIKYLTYQWNEDEPETVYPEEGETLIIEEIIEIQRGKNTIKITAVDSSNNETVEEKAFNGVNEPEIKVYVKNGYLCMQITHDIGIKKIDYTINGKQYIFDETYKDYEKEKKQVIRKKRLQEGENKIEITAYSLEDTQSSYKGKTQYTPTE